mmetsp:Transcript_2036/g.8157  ORF Transcript_2036/g.8157 Transcript_2036/m.8157 type:complete len:316 (+) Transcript_2036:580-1527(+)
MRVEPMKVRPVADGVLVPDMQQVIVTAGRELVATRRPLQPANLLGVRGKRGGAVLADANVVHHHGVVPAACGELRAIPRERADAGVVTAQGTHLLEPAHVPDLNLGVVGADGDVLAVAAPLHAGDVIVTVVGIRLAQLLDVAAVRVPEVHHASERHGDLVGGSPVDEVQVVVVDELGRVEDPLRCGGDVPERLLGLDPSAGVVCVHAARRVLHPGGGLGSLGLEREDLRRARAAVLAQKVARQLLLVLLLAGRRNLRREVQVIGVGVLLHEVVVGDVQIQRAAVGDEAVGPRLPRGLGGVLVAEAVKHRSVHLNP